MTLPQLINPSELNGPALGRRANGGAGRSYADTVERLFTEFGSRVSLPVITGVVRECRGQLSYSPEAAIPERLERLARQRLRTGARSAAMVGVEEQGHDR